jgi:transcriptional regulator with PAS, ATPase and Fis domain
MSSAVDKIFEELLDCSPVATFGIDPDHQIIFWNKACEGLTGLQASDMIGTKDHWRAFYNQERPCLADIAISGKYEELPKLYKIYRRSLLLKEGLHAEGWYPMVGLKKRYLTFDAVPVYNDKGHLISAIETLQDRTEQKLIEEERGIQFLELQKVLSSQKTLRGYIPICASCKRVRDNTGAWTPIETHVTEHSEAKFTHTICPECSKKAYPDFYKD